jgi:hypothetical protein
MFVYKASRIKKTAEECNLRCDLVTQKGAKNGVFLLRRDVGSFSRKDDHEIFIFYCYRV